MTSAQRGVKKYPKFADKQYISFGQKGGEGIKNYILKPPNESLVGNNWMFKTINIIICVCFQFPVLWFLTILYEKAL